MTQIVLLICILIIGIVILLLQLQHKSTTGDKGYKKVLKQYPDDAVPVPVDSNEVILDCDTKDDYFQMIKQN